MWSLSPEPDLPLWRPDGSTHRARVAFTTRRGGVSAAPYHSLNLGRSTDDDPSAVETNRARVLAALGLPPGRVATAGQVHGAVVAPVRASGLHPQCDALVTTESELALAISGADCLPIVFAAPGAVAVAHAGWRGVAAGVPARALEAVRAAAGGATAADVRVWFGPCIRPCCYVVGSEVADRFASEVVKRREGASYLDVAAAARLQLLDSGLPESALLDVLECTSCRADRYFSHRRDRGITGRQWGIVARASSADES